MGPEMSDQIVVNGKAFPLTKDRYIIGRGEHSDILLPENDGKASRSHARIAKSGEGIWVVTDLQSTNGTLHNGVRIHETTVINHGDVLTIGAVTIVFDLKASQSSTRQIQDKGKTSNDLHDSQQATRTNQLNTSVSSATRFDIRAEEISNSQSTFWDGEDPAAKPVSQTLEDNVLDPFPRNAAQLSDAPLADNSTPVSNPLSHLNDPQKNLASDNVEPRPSETSIKHEEASIPLVASRQQEPQAEPPKPVTEQGPLPKFLQPSTGLPQHSAADMVPPVQTVQSVHWDQASPSVNVLRPPVNEPQEPVLTGQLGKAAYKLAGAVPFSILLISVFLPWVTAGPLDSLLNAALGSTSYFNFMLFLPRALSSASELNIGDVRMFLVLIPLLALMFSAVALFSSPKPGAISSTISGILGLLFAVIAIWQTGELMRFAAIGFWIFVGGSIFSLALGVFSLTSLAANSID